MTLIKNFWVETSDGSTFWRFINWTIAGTDITLTGALVDVDSENGIKIIDVMMKVL